MFKKVLILVGGWLVIVNIIGLLALNRLNLSPDDAYSWIPVEKYTQDQSWNVINMHARWDSNWYMDIVKNGYELREVASLSNIVFFPLYPFLIKMIAIMIGGNLILAGWIVSSIFLILACIILFHLVEKFHKEANPFLTVFLLLIFPTAFFLNAVYTESLFLFLSLLAFYFCLDRKYFYAGIIGLLAALTRVTGLLLFVPLVMQFFINEGFAKDVYKKSTALLLIPIGTGLFFLFHWIRFGDPLLFFEIESAWGRSFHVNHDHFIFLTHAALANMSFDIIYVVFGLTVATYLVYRKQYPYAFYMVSTIGVAVASGTLMSIGRYILVLFPIFIVGASIKNDTSRYIWIIISSMLMALNTYLFVNWYWAG